MAEETCTNLDILRKAWYRLRLSVRCPLRIPTWDAIIVTAASPNQAKLYQWHLDRAKRRQRIAESTIVLAVPDPQGHRIGSGGATLFAIQSLFEHLSKELAQKTASRAEALHEVILNKRILLVHAGGDSKRVPWANTMGKAFIPVPLRVVDDPDESVPSLFDHILAISSLAVQNFRMKGGLLIMTGDVLPIFDMSSIILPHDGVVVVTVSAPLEVAVNHGIIVSHKTNQSSSSLLQADEELEIVVNLLQKPSAKEVVESGALRSSGSALLDTGIFLILGKAWSDLVGFALGELDPVMELLVNKVEVSLYEELAGAWVPARHEWLKSRPLGEKLAYNLSSQPLYSYCAEELLFLHFGTSNEVLNHFSQGFGKDTTRHLNIIPNNVSNGIASSAVILSSEILDVTHVGERSLVLDSTLGGGVYIGSRCVALGIHINEKVDESPWSISSIDKFPLLLPDKHCLWNIPLQGSGETRVTLCCSIEDNPKTLVDQGGTFCGIPWGTFLRERCLEKQWIWPSQDSQLSLWNAKIFPVLPTRQGISFAMWLMGGYREHSEDFVRMWKECEHISLADLQSHVDFSKLCKESSDHRSKLALRLAKASLAGGLFERNLSSLCLEIGDGHDDMNADACKELLGLCQTLENSSDMLQVPYSRFYQAMVDLQRTCGHLSDASSFEEKVSGAVTNETAAAVEQKCLGNIEAEGKNLEWALREAKVELPVRVDVVGGWSDTPPWSLERVGRVLNMAILLEASAPVGAHVRVESNVGILLQDDIGNMLTIEDPTKISHPFDIDDPFRLVKSALLITGIAKGLAYFNLGLQIKTWAKVPRGSGLGTSSILAAAVVKCLLRVSGGDESNENVSNLVLMLEQVMGTGGGWQDQIGGLYPGIKLTTSYPLKPLKLNVEYVPLNHDLHIELEERMVVAFTGQVRLAHQVLETVVRRYLQRDRILISTVSRLAELALSGKNALLKCDLEELGRIMSEAWLLHQELDPHCSNAFVDSLFSSVAHLSCGSKLVGAGGGGFALIIAKNKEATQSIKGILQSFEPPVRVYDWRFCL